MRLDRLKISLAAARVNAEMTQDDVSKILRVSNKTVLNWEKGKAIPSYATLKTLSDIYQIPIDNIRLPKELT